MYCEKLLVVVREREREREKERELTTCVHGACRYGFTVINFFCVEKKETAFCLFCVYMLLLGMLRSDVHICMHINDCIILWSNRAIFVCVCGVCVCECVCVCVCVCACACSVILMACWPSVQIFLDVGKERHQSFDHRPHPNPSCLEFLGKHCVCVLNEII